jgi:hypothetical protein
VGWIAPRGWDVALFVLLGVTGAVAHLFMTWSLRFAPSATLAPMQYLEIPIATFVGLMIFGDLPNGLAALGIVVTIAAGSTSSRASGPSPARRPRPLDLPQGGGPVRLRKAEHMEDRTATPEHGHSQREVEARIADPGGRGHLRDIIYGAIDGAVTTFAIVAGVAGAGLSPS